MLGRKSIDPQTSVDYDALGRAVEKALVQDYVYLLHSTRRQMWSSFVRGLFMGLGTVLGATVLVALLLAILQLFDAVPWIGRYIHDISTQIESN